MEILLDPIYYLDFLIGLVKWFFSSPLFFWFKVIIGIYCLILFVNIILLLQMRNVGGNLRTTLKGTDMPLITPSKMMKRWRKVKDRLKSKNESQYKVAILEADAIADEILQGIGYKGDNMTERLAGITPAQLDGLEELKAAHSIRNRVVHDEHLKIDEKMASETVQIYENFLRYLEFL